MIKSVLFDLSGVLYVSEGPLPGAVQSLQRLTDAGVPMYFITNTTRSPRQAVATRLSAMGFAISENDILTAPVATREYLIAKNLSPLMLIHPNLEPEFADLVSDQPNVVVVGDAAQSFTYDNLNAAFRLLLEGAPLLAMGENRYFKEKENFSLDAGPFVVALEYAADVDATVIGKPAQAFFDAAVTITRCQHEEVVMIGDDVQADVIGALDAGLHGVLVRTGKYRTGDEDLLPEHGVCVDDINVAVDWILQQCQQC